MILNTTETSDKKVTEKRLPIINCHTHIFTSGSVPPLLAKTFVPFPIYWLLHIGWILSIVNWYYSSNYSPYKWRSKRWHILSMKMLYMVKITAVRSRFWRIVKFLIGVVIVASAFHELYRIYLHSWLVNQNLRTAELQQLASWLERLGILIITQNWMLKGVLLVLLLTFFPSGRNFLVFILKKFSRLFGMLPGRQTKELILRYINIVRFARYKEQSKIFSRLHKQYPPDAAMVVLPMDMEFMEAGTPKQLYEVQMRDLAAIKKNHPRKIYPFIFVDPRRKTVDNAPFFEYEVVNGSIRLLPCFIKTYLEEHNFSGFKIYPALGYYPFDEKLLPLWKYAADNNIPILTHCIRGTIYFRGRKKKEWDQHPVFEQYEGDQSDKKAVVPEYFQPLTFPQMKASDVQEIFTHPLNYACLLKRDWLVKLVGKAEDSRIHALFGYDPEKGTIDNGLEHLKICFGHFGGDDEWAKCMERDRDNWAHQVLQYPDRGIDFIFNSDGSIGRGKAEQIWKSADWYSIICSLMLQHKNVYADISYILHNEKEILPLLKQTLDNRNLNKQVLFGTDFYVVRNHKSDKEMLADIMGGLSEEHFDQIARINPRSFLNLT